MIYNYTLQQAIIKRRYTAKFSFSNGITILYLIPVLTVDNIFLFVFSLPVGFLVVYRYTAKIMPDFPQKQPGIPVYLKTAQNTGIPRKIPNTVYSGIVGRIFLYRWKPYKTISLSLSVQSQNGICNNISFVAWRVILL